VQQKRYRPEGFWDKGAMARPGINRVSSKSAPAISRDIGFANPVRSKIKQEEGVARFVIISG